MLVGGPALADALFDWRGLIPLLLFPIAAFMIWVIALSRVTDRARRERMAAAASEVQGELADIRNASLREWGLRVGSVVSGLGAFFIGQYVFEGYVERVNRSATSYYDRVHPGMQHWFLLIAVGVVTGLAVSRLLAPKPALTSAVPATTGGIFDDSVSVTGSISVRQKISLMSLLFGSMSRDQYELLDGGQAFCARAAERSGFFSRLFLGGRRPIDLVVDDLGHEALRVRRGFLWLPFFFNRATVAVETRGLGSIEQRLSLVREYALRGPDGAERYQLRSGLIFRSRFKLLRGGTEVGEVLRVRKPWYLRMFTPAWRQQDHFSLAFPPDASLDDKKLLTGSVFLIDITHFPTQASVRWGALILFALLFVPADPPEDRAAPYGARDYDAYDY